MKRVEISTRYVNQDGTEYGGYTPDVDDIRYIFARARGNQKRNYTPDERYVNLLELLVEYPELKTTDAAVLALVLDVADASPTFDWELPSDAESEEEDFLVQWPLVRSVLALSGYKNHDFSADLTHTDALTRVIRDSSANAKAYRFITVRRLNADVDALRPASVRAAVRRDE